MRGEEKERKNEGRMGIKCGCLGFWLFLGFFWLFSRFLRVKTRRFPNMKFGNAQVWTRPGVARTGGYLIAMDAIGAGHGEIVLILGEGTGARQILDDSNAPVRSIDVGIVNAVEFESS